MYKIFDTSAMHFENDAVFEQPQIRVLPAGLAGETLGAIDFVDRLRKFLASQ